MSLDTGRHQLEAALRDLLQHWDETRAHWNDGKSQEFEARFLAPLRPRITAAVDACGALGVVVAKVRKECGADNEV